MTENVDERTLPPLLVPDFAGLLEDIRSNSGTPRTVGLSDSVIADFCRRDSSLGRAIEEAHSVHVSLRDEVGAATLPRQRHALLGGDPRTRGQRGAARLRLRVVAGVEAVVALG